MKCNICEKEFTAVSLVYGSGFVCKGCESIAQRRRQEFHAGLLAEEIGEMPDTFDTASFERFALKFSLHYLKNLGEEDRKRIGDANPMLLVPEEFSLWFKEQVLRHIPDTYISSIEARGHARLFGGGEYWFIKPLPSDVVFKAMKKARIID